MPEFDDMPARIARAKQLAEARLEQARTTSRDLIERAQDRSTELYDSAREQAATRWDEGKNLAGDSYEKGKDFARSLPERGRDAYEKHPLTFLAATATVAALLGSLLPTRKAGRAKMHAAADSVRARATQARKAGSAGLETLASETSAARSHFKTLVERAGKAAKSAGEAAADVIKKRD